MSSVHVHVQAHTSVTRESAIASAVCAPSPLHFVFAGIELQLRPDPDVVWALPMHYHRTMITGAAIPAVRERTLAYAVCAISLDARLAGHLQPGRIAYCEQREQMLHLRADELEAEIVRGAGNDSERAHYEIRARVGRLDVLPQLLLHLTVALVERSGGLCLHATAVELAGRAVLLLGPSGAGKSTAAGMLDRVTCLANDRVVLVPLVPMTALVAGVAAPYAVWALPVGRPPALEPYAGAVLPLAALLRVVQAKRAAILPLTAAQTALYVREAIETAVDEGAFELERLDAVSTLAQAARGGSAHVSLDGSWRPALEQFLCAAWAGTEAFMEGVEP